MNCSGRILLTAVFTTASLGVRSFDLHACGPWLPEQILTSRQVILRTPVGDFAQEVMALTEEDGAPALPPGCTRVAWLPHAPDEDAEAAESHRFDKEAVELRAALASRGGAIDLQESIVTAYEKFHAEMSRAADRSETFDMTYDDDLGRIPFDERARKLREKQSSPVPGGSVLPTFLTEQLPGEWADYLEGAWRFRNNDLAGARAAWERVLARPQAERLYCSINAAYMLARIQDDFTVPHVEKVRRYQRVLQLRADGCRDMYNLASACCGWEARCALADRDLPAAARLYYLQAVTSGGGDDPDLIRTSLCDVATTALGREKADPAAMAAAARDPFLRRVVTLYVACHRYFGEEPSHCVPPLPPTPGVESGPPDQAGIGPAWLAALDQAGVNTVREAASIAWAAYEEADFVQAAAWLDKAPATDGLALWLRAKLALHDGKPDVAARCFAQAIHSYPAAARDISADLDNSTNIAGNGAAFRTSQFQADLGIISLARSDYAQALTALLRSGFWNDAAYVAERVLTVNELRAYVRTNFPQAPPPRQPPPPADRYGEAEDRFSGWYFPPLNALQSLQERLAPIHSANPAAYSLRYLLARRLARDGRYAEARECYPQALWPKFDEYVAARKLGADPRQPRARRADALWRAAKITRWLGMELFGTDDEPDWYVYSGDFEGESYRDDRLGRPPAHDAWQGTSPAASLTQIPPASQNEQRRIAKDQVRPESRYHYRYPAADLAWQAATLMPDQQDSTAHVLAAAGWWLESVEDDKAADRFYQAIVRRCGQTDLGRQADKTRALPVVPHEDP